MKRYPEASKKESMDHYLEIQYMPHPSLPRVEIFDMSEYSWQPMGNLLIIVPRHPKPGHMQQNKLIPLSSIYFMEENKRTPENAPPKVDMEAVKELHDTQYGG